jgi:hypothetical protein
MQDQQLIPLIIMQIIMPKTERRLKIPISLVASVGVVAAHVHGKSLSFYTSSQVTYDIRNDK